MNLILKIIYELLAAWEQYKTKRAKVKRDDEIDELRKNPTNWYRNHFNGVRDLPTDATDADKTDTKPD